MKFLDFLSKIRHRRRNIKYNNIIKSFWFKPLPVKYWIDHYYAHLKTIVFSTKEFISGTYDLTLLYLLKETYNSKDMRKLKKIIKTICLSYVDENIDFSNELERAFILENFVLAYILGFLELDEEEHEKFIRFTFSSEKEIRINLKLEENQDEVFSSLRESAFFIFPYFSLLFSNCFENKTISINEGNIDNLKKFFNQNSKVGHLVENFVSWCVENKIGVFQYISFNEEIYYSMNPIYRTLIEYIDIFEDNLVEDMSKLKNVKTFLLNLNEKAKELKKQN